MVAWTDARVGTGPEQGDRTRGWGAGPSPCRPRGARAGVLEGVPLAALGALTLPTGRFRAAGTADESGLAAAHDAPDASTHLTAS